MKKLLAAAGAAALLAAVLFAAWALRPGKQSAHVLESLDTAPAMEENVIAYVPLDDRTDNLEDVVYLAESSGYRVAMPDHDLYRTALDGQRRNENGTAFGDRAALFQWVADMDAAGCDLFVLSLDQLFSGGLVNSRSMAESVPLAFPDGRTLSEEEAFAAFLLPLAEDPDNRVYLFDSVVRLSPTVGYRGFDVEEYYALRQYGMVARTPLAGDALTLESVFAHYPFGEDGETAAESLLEDNTCRHILTEDILREYLGVRRRKLTLTDAVISAMERLPEGRMQLLIGIDDSSNTTNIQYNELAYLQKRLGPNTGLMAGLDSLARLLIGELARDRYGYTLRASVRYVGNSQERPGSEFDRYTLAEVTDLHLDLFGVERVSEAEAELQFVLMTAPEFPERAEEYQEELLSLLEYNQARRIPTVLIEASNNAYGETLERALLERVDFASLVAFAGKYDQANVAGAGYAMGFARYLYLKCREDKALWCDEAHIKQLANSMALTEYILYTRYPLNLYVQDLGLNYNNMLPTPLQKKRIARKLESLFRPECDKVCANLTGTALLCDLPWAERAVKSVEITDLYFPWNRTFELSFTVRAELGA